MSVEDVGVKRKPAINTVQRETRSGSALPVPTLFQNFLYLFFCTAE